MAALVAAQLVVACSGQASAPPLASRQQAAVGQPSAAPNVAAGTCHLLDGARPDPSCTPGALSPLVRPETAWATICAPEWAQAQPPPPQGALLAAQARVVARYGVEPAAAYAVVPLIPGELGGDDAAEANLLPVPLRGAYNVGQKLHVDDDLHRRVCSLGADRLGLVEAQQRVTLDWIGLAIVAGLAK